MLLPIENGPTEGNHRAGPTRRWAAAGHLEVIRDLRGHGIHCTADGADEAAENGHSHVLADLAAHGIHRRRDPAPTDDWGLGCDDDGWYSDEDDELWRQFMRRRTISPVQGILRGCPEFCFAFTRHRRSTPSPPDSCPAHPHRHGFSDVCMFLFCRLFCFAFMLLVFTSARCDSSVHFVNSHTHLFLYHNPISSVFLFAPSLFLDASRSLASSHPNPPFRAKKPLYRQSPNPCKISHFCASNSS